MADADRETGEIIDEPVDEAPSEDEEGPRQYATEAVEFLTLHRDGTFLTDLGETLADVGQKVRELGLKGAVNVQFTIAPGIADGAMMAVYVSDYITSKVPKRATAQKLMFVDEDGRMSKRVRSTRRQKLLPGIDED